MKKKRRLQRADAIWLSAVSLLVLLQFWWLPGDPGTPDDTYSTTIEGKRGFYQTLENLSAAGMLPPVKRESSKLIPDENCTLVILSPDRYPDDNEKHDLRDFVMNGGSIIFAPNWQYPDIEIASLNIRIEQEYFYQEDTAYSGGTSGRTTPAVIPPGTTPAELPAEAEPPSDAPSGSTRPETPSDKNSAQVVPTNTPAPPGKTNGNLKDTNPPDLPPNSPALETTVNENETPTSDFQTESQLVDGPIPWRTRASMNTSGQSPTVLVKSSSGTVQAASWNYGNGFVVLSASSDVFSNRAMLNPVQAELAVRLVEHAHSHHAQPFNPSTTPIIVSEYLNASDSYTGTGVLMSPALRSGTLQLITIALLAGWFGFHRFGPAKAIHNSKRRSLNESAAAVGNLHFRTHSGGEAVHNYLEYMKTQLQKLFGRSVHLTDTETIAARSGLDVMTVEQTINSASDLAGRTNTATLEAAAAIRGLSTILNRLHGNRPGG